MMCLVCQNEIVGLIKIASLLLCPGSFTKYVTVKGTPGKKMSFVYNIREKEQSGKSLYKGQIWVPFLAKTNQY